MINTGHFNSEQVIQIAQTFCKDNHVTEVVVASTNGATGLAVTKAFTETDVNVIVVAHSVGFRSANTNEFQPDILKEIEALGGAVLFSTMPFHGINDAVRSEMGSSLTL